MLPVVEHDWNLSPRAAAALQLTLAPEIRFDGGPAKVDLVAGVDVAVGGRFGQTPGRGAVVVLSYPQLAPVEQAVVQRSVSFPYVPGLLSFREIPVLLPAFAQLRAVPNLLMVDGQGWAHPRRMGLASHLGLLLDIPTIGCAKSRLIGEFGPLGSERGCVEYLRDPGRDDEIIGAAVRTRTGTKPVFVSVGHRIRLDEAIDWTLRLAPLLRVPMPTRLAHEAAAGRQVAPASCRSDKREDK